MTKRPIEAQIKEPNELITQKRIKLESSNSITKTQISYDVPPTNPSNDGEHSDSPDKSNEESSSVTLDFVAKGATNPSITKMKQVEGGNIFETAENSNIIIKDRQLDPELNAIIMNSLKEIDEVANKDPAAPEHLRNVLKVIKGVYDSPSACRGKLQKLYDHDPYMLNAADEITRLVLLVSGTLSDVKISFKPIEKNGIDFIDYIYEVQVEVAKILVDRYSSLITYDENFELSLIGNE